MDKDKILDYVRKTPANTNPNVLKTMLDDSGGEMNPGYSCTETVTLLTDESVTTVFDEVNNSGKLAYSTSIDADTIRVTFDGTEYTCNAQEGEMGTLYGAPMGEEGIDWSEYPFQISSGLRNDIYTETAGTYRVKIETVEEVVETTPCFEKAVNSVVGGGSGGSGSSEADLIKLVSTDDPSIVRLNKTPVELLAFLESGKSPFVYADEEEYSINPFVISGLIKYIRFNDRNTTYTIHVLDPDPDGSAMDFVGHFDDYPTATIS